MRTAQIQRKTAETQVEVSLTSTVRAVPKLQRVLGSSIICCGRSPATVYLTSRSTAPAIWK